MERLSPREWLGPRGESGDRGAGAGPAAEAAAAAGSGMDGGEERDSEAGAGWVFLDGEADVEVSVWARIGPRTQPGTRVMPRA